MNIGRNGSDIRITCKSHTTLPIGDLVWFQGNLAELSKDSLKRLQNAIRRHGIFMALSVWNDEGENKLVDGHARLYALKDMGYTGHVPVNYVMAESYDDAREKVLLARSQSNVTTEEGLYEFSHDLDWEIMPDLLDLPNISFSIFNDFEQINDLNEMNEWNESDMPEFAKNSKSGFRLAIHCDSENRAQEFVEKNSISIEKKLKDVWICKI